MSSATAGHVPDVYTHGQHEAVLRAHRWRTAQNSAAYLLPELRPGQRLLDVGCGQGTITVGLAALVHPGEVVGLDRSPEVVDLARQTARDADATNASFEVGDVYALPYDDDAFDVVHAHQLLQHLTDPVAALRELRRVTRPGGLVAVRDADYAAMTWYPPSPGLVDWSELYHEVTAANGAQADAGRRLLGWLHQAGFDRAGTTPSASAWCYATAADRAWWSATWAERSVSSDFATQAIDYGFADEVALEAIAEAWVDWGKEPDGWFAVLHGEVLARA